jgi:predicted nucleic acid-binding protein
MIFPLDTNAVSDFMDRHAVLDQHLAALAPDDHVVTCTIVRGEILYGIEKLPAGKRKDALSAKAHATLNGIRCELIPVAAGDVYGKLKAQAQGRGKTLDDNDLCIAATAIALGAILVSRDPDVRKIPALRIEDWTV